MRTARVTQRRSDRHRWFVGQAFLAAAALIAVAAVTSPAVADGVSVRRPAAAPMPVTPVKLPLEISVPGWNQLFDYLVSAAAAALRAGK